MKISLRVRGVAAEKQFTELVHKRAQLALGRFSTHIANVVVRLEDLNGPKGGIDKRCTIELTGTFGKRLAEVREHDFTAAVDLAFAVAQRSVARQIRRNVREYGFVQ